MKGILVLIIFMSTIYLAPAQNAQKKLLNEPLFFLDSVSVAFDEIKQLPTEDITIVSVLKDRAAVDLAGEKGRNGIVFIESKTYSRKKYWIMLAAVSQSFTRAIPTPGADVDFKYIKGKEIADTPVAILGGLTENDIRKVSILSKKKMLKKFGVKNKNGVLIKVRK